MMRVNHDGFRTVMARLGSLIRPNLINPRTKSYWSPGHRTPSCDYAQDSPSSALLLLIHYIIQHVLYTLMYTYAHTDTYAHTQTHICTHTQTHTHVHMHTCHCETINTHKMLPSQQLSIPTTEQLASLTNDTPLAKDSNITAADSCLFSGC